MFKPCKTALKEESYAEKSLFGMVVNSGRIPIFIPGKTRIRFFIYGNGAAGRLVVC